MHRMVTMKRLIEIWGTISGVAEALGRPYPTVQSWCHRGVPAKRFLEIIKAAEAAGYVVTLEHLAGQIASDQHEDAA